MTRLLRFTSALIFAFCPLILVAAIAYVVFMEYRNTYIMACVAIFSILALYIGFRIFVLVQKYGVLKFISHSYNTEELEEIDF